jgi:hypothetical protein
MPAPSVNAIRNDFLKQVNQSILLLASVRGRGTPFFQLEQIAEVVYLRVYSSWENVSGRILHPLHVRCSLRFWGTTEMLREAAKH